MISKVLVSLSMLICIYGCSNRSHSEISFLSKEVNFKACDTLVCSGNDTLLFSEYLFPLRINRDELIAYDMLTKNLLLYNKSTPENSQLFDIKAIFSKYRSLPNTLFGIVEVGEGKYLICSEPYFLLVNNKMEILKVYDIDLYENSIKYFVVGDVTNIKYSETINKVYFPVSPMIPKEHDDYYNSGRVAELNLNTSQFSILPLSLPNDYTPKTEYQLFALPLIEIVDDNLFCIYPGSNILYKYNLLSQAKTSVFINTRNADIKAKEIGSSMEDMAYSYLECDNFYQMLGDENKLLLFYWQGKKRKTFNRKKGIAELNCYILGYNYVDNEIIFDVPFDMENVLKKPYRLHSDVLYMVSQIEDTDIIRTKILGYEMEIK